MDRRTFCSALMGIFAFDLPAILHSRYAQAKSGFSVQSFKQVETRKVLFEVCHTEKVNPFKIKEYHCQGLRRAKIDKHAVYIGAVFDADIIIFQIVTHHFSHCCFLWAVFSFCHKNTPKLSNSILHQFGGLHKL